MQWVLYAGMVFKALWAVCLKSFLVSSEANLRGHLTEFSDHDLVTTKYARLAAPPLPSRPAIICHTSQIPP